MPELHSDLNRALSKAFVLSILGTMLCVLFGAFSDVLAIYMMDKPTAPLLAHQAITLKALSGNAILFAAPILATIPYSGAFVDDVKSGYLKQFLPRTTVSRYILGKEMACAISGFLSLTIGILAGHILVSLFVLPMETFGETAVESQLGELVGKIVIFGFSGDLAPENRASYNVRKERKKTNKGAERRWQERITQSSRSSSSCGK